MAPANAGQATKPKGMAKANARHNNHKPKARLKQMQEYQSKQQGMARANARTNNQKPKAWLEQMQEEQPNKLRHG